MAPGKKGASTIPKKNLTTSRPAGEDVALVQPLTMAQMIMHPGYRKLVSVTQVFPSWRSNQKDMRLHLGHKHC